MVQNTRKEYTMIDEVVISNQLLANLTNLDETKNFIFEVLNEYIQGSYAPLQNGRIDGGRVKRHLECMLEDSIKKKNPTFNSTVQINVEWGLRSVCGFSCRIIVGISDFDLTPFGPSAVEAVPLWQ